MTRRSNHTATPPASASPRPPLPTPGDASAAWGPYASSRAFLSNMATIVVILACVSLLAFSLHAAARFLLRVLARRRAARALAQGQAQTPKPSPDAADAGWSLESGAGGGVELAGGWADAECPICLSELADGERVRVLPAWWTSNAKLRRKLPHGISKIIVAALLPYQSINMYKNAYAL